MPHPVLYDQHHVTSSSHLITPPGPTLPPNAHLPDRHTQCSPVGCTPDLHHPPLSPEQRNTNNLPEITLRHFLRDLNPFPGHKKRWEIIECEPSTPLRNGMKVFVEHYGEVVLKKKRTSDPEWTVFRCVGKDGSVVFEAAAWHQKVWCEERSLHWFSFPFFC